ncbi:MAG: mechanosensitive ion channel [Gammaproteobacteria bacterium]|nr:mechanosensitive ion channel [Gammaproteobacteria bacterium]MBT8444117.1 mechanosensitive ion channel [Gammaproteobacteria bacterium]
MEQLNSVFSYTLISLADQSITVGQVSLVLAILIGGYLLARGLERLIVNRMTSRSVSPDLIHLVRRIYLVVVLAILIITILDLLNVPLTAFAFISGAIAIGIGFGAQNIINNFISGWILMWERPIRIGDFLEIGETKGKVEAINTRSTRIRRVDGVHLLIPNSYLLENTVVNWTLVDRLTRTIVRVGVAYGSPVRKVAELIEQAANEHADVLKDPEPMVIFDDFGDNALIFDLYFWVHAVGDRDLRVIRSDIRFRVDDLFHENGIVIAFPQRDVHVDGLGPVDVRLVSAEDPGDER